MNIVGKDLEAKGYEFIAINSQLKKNPQFVLPGHFYSLLPDIEYVMQNETNIFFKKNEKTIPGIDLNEEDQLNLLEEFSNYYKELPGYKAACDLAGSNIFGRSSEGNTGTRIDQLRSKEW